MTVFEVAQQMGIAYSNQFLLRAGAAVARKLAQHPAFSDQYKAIKEQDEFGKKYTVWDYHRHSPATSKMPLTKN